MRVRSRGSCLSLHFAKRSSNVHFSLHCVLKGVRRIRSSVGGCESINEILHDAQRAGNPRVMYRMHKVRFRSAANAATRLLL